MAEATWPLRQRPRTLDRRAPDWRRARGEVGWSPWAWSIRLSIHCLAGVGFTPLHGSIDGCIGTPNYGVYGFRLRPRTCLRVSLRRQPRIAQKAERVNELGGLICITRGLGRFPPKPLPPILRHGRCPCGCRPPAGHSRPPAIDHRVRARTFPAPSRALGLAHVCPFWL